jgi:hypothetical protein
MGYKLQHLIPAFFIIVAGGLLFFAHWLLAIPTILIGILLLCMRSGIEIDQTKKQIRKYSALSNLKLGAWVNLKIYHHVELKHTSISQTMSSRAQSTTVRTKTYDLIFFNAAGQEYEFNDFTDYKIAVQVFKTVASSLGITSRNHIEERIAKNKELKKK